MTNLTIRCGEDWSSTMTYTKNGTPTQVDLPHAMIKANLNADALLNLTDIGMSPYITQPSAGVLVFSIPSEVTSELTPGYNYLWDLFGTVAGQRIKLVPTSPVDILAAVTR